MTEQELVEGIIQKNRDAIGYLVNHYQENVIRTAYHFVRNREDAEDLAQEVFLEVVRSISGFRSKAALNTWIYRITVNRSLDFLRKQKNRNRMVQLETFFRISPGIEKEPVMVIAESPHPVKEKRELLDRAVNSLPGNQKIAFVLNKYDELSYKEIAGIMNLSLSSVESLIHRAKINLQKKLVSYFSEYENKRR